MAETNFFQSWAFWFLVGIAVGFIAGFALAIILAASGKASRMEEKIEDDLYSYQIHNKVWKPRVEIVKQNNPGTD